MPLPSEVLRLRPLTPVLTGPPYSSPPPRALRGGEGCSVPTAHTVCQAARRGAHGAGLREPMAAPGTSPSFQVHKLDLEHTTLPWAFLNLERNVTPACAATEPVKFSF